MNSKKGYKIQKSEFSTGKWLKYYFLKFTCRKVNIKEVRG